MAQDKENQVFSIVKNRYFELDKDFDKLLEACKTDEEKKELKKSYLEARSNFKKLSNLQFNENDPKLKKLTEDLKKAEKGIEKAIKAGENVSFVLSAIAQSVQVATAIVDLVI